MKLTADCLYSPSTALQTSDSHRTRYEGYLPGARLRSPNPCAYLHSSCISTMKSRLTRALSRAKHAAIFAAIGAGVGGLFGRSTASSGAALGAFIGATIGEKRVTTGSVSETIKSEVSGAISSDEGSSRRNIT